MAVTRSLLRGVEPSGSVAALRGAQGHAATDSGAFLGVLENILDASVINQTATDINQMLQMFAGDLVMIVGIQVLVLEGGTCVIDVGDTTIDAGYYDSINCNTGTVPVRYTSAVPYTIAADTPIVPTAGQNAALYAVPGMRLYTTATASDRTVNITEDNTTTKHKVRVTALVVSMDGNLSLT
jgi:peptidoglycan hydrolase-like amidase